jgi:hypothetical protein
MYLRKGALVKAKPGTIEGDSEKHGVGVLIEDSRKDEYGQWHCRVQWISASKPWFHYVQDLEVLSDET